MINRIIRISLNVISVTAIIVALTAMLVVVFTPSGQTPSFFGYSMLRVLTGSMEPSLPTNSFVIVHKIDAAEIASGDIITFYSADPKLGGALNTHRVMSVEQTAEGYKFTTKGDANIAPDAYKVKSDSVIGTVVFHSAVIGKGVALLSNPLLFVLIIVTPLLAMIVYNLYCVIRTAYIAVRREEKEAMEQELEIKNVQNSAEESQNDDKTK